VNGLLLLLILAGGFLAGIMNVMAGGGSLITLPLLIFAGLPANVANGTNRVAILLQNVSAVASFRRRGLRPGRRAWVLMVPTLVGAAVGARVAVELDETVLRRAIGVILVVMLVPVLRPARRRGDGVIDPPSSPWMWPVYAIIGAWGGFIQVGVGFLYLAFFTGLHRMDLVRANLLKVFFVLGYSVLALALFLLSGQVSLGYGLVLAVGNMAGGWVGARLAVEKGEGWIRVVLVVAVLASAAKLLGLFGG
jgi:uncharacterized membrane protein YfcA